jgi:hypothetical protein
MNGTLAIWYEPEDGGNSAQAIHKDHGQPSLEIHFNLWRDNPSKTNFLDIGLRLSDIKSVNRIYIYFPVSLRLDQFQDLSTVMAYGQTLDAVFNMVVEVGSKTDLRYETIKNGEPFVTVHKVNIGDDLTLEPVEDALKGTGSTITFTEAMCTRLRAGGSGPQYLRLRLHLTGNSQTLFTQEIIGQEKIFVSSSQRLELTELRLNEQRSFPHSIAKRASANAFNIVRVHYFLIRELGHALVTQHAPIRKVRRLEAKLWASYLRGREIPAQDAAEEERLLSRLIIYHWRDGSEEEPIQDFTAFASFQASTPGLLFYMIGVVLLGAVGSALHDLGKGYWGTTQTTLPYLLGGLAVLWAVARTGVWAWLETRAGQVRRAFFRALKHVGR